MLGQWAGGVGPAAQAGGENGLQSWDSLGRLMVHGRLRDTDPLSSPHKLLVSVTCSHHGALCPSTVHPRATQPLCATAPVPPAGDANSLPRKERKCLGAEPGDLENTNCVCMQSDPHSQVSITILSQTFVLLRL